MVDWKHWCLIVILIPIPCHAVECPPAGKPGTWAHTATYLCSTASSTGFVRNITVYAPDHLKAVHVMNDRWTLVAGDKTIELPIPDSYVSFYPAELSWAPDSRAFYITQSDATSEIDGFHTEVYIVSDAHANRGLDITQEVLARFRLNNGCSLAFGGDVRYDDSDANIAALAWVDGSNQILVVAEVPSDSSCEIRGYFGGFLVSVADG